MTARLTARDVIERLTDELTNRHTDKWGEAMGAHFTIAYALDDRANGGWPVIPSAWGFHDPMGRGIDNIEDPYTRAWIRKVRTDTLLRAGNILERYENRLERAGRSY